MRLNDRIALVTGGGSGIGRAICLRFAGEGATVIAVDRYLNAAQETVDLVQAAGGRGLALQADVAKSVQVNAAAHSALSHFGRVDILVNNAAISKGDDILTIDEETWDLNLAIVLKGVYLFSKALLPRMIAQRRGNIINISSVNGLSGIGEEPYSAAKAGMINLTQNMAVRYGPAKVRANVICPGTVQTPIWGARVAKDPAVFDKLAKWYPLRRVGQPEDIANAALFLASDESSWITGAVLNVDGGLMAGNSRFGEDLSAV